MDTPESNLPPSFADQPPEPDTLQADLLLQPAPLRVPWRLRDLWFFLAFLLFALLVCSFVTVVGYEILRPFFGWNIAFDNLRNDAFFNIAFQAILYVMVLGYLYVLVRLYYRLPFWSGVGLRHLSARRAVQFAVLGGALSLAVEVASALVPDKTKFPLEELFSSPAAAYALAVFAVLIAPPMEELLFRGVLFAFLERLDLRLAVAGTAVLFAALHIQEYRGAWNHVFLLFLVGLVFSLARGATGSLTPSIVLHMSYNATQMVVLFLASDHFRHMPRVG